MKETKSTPVKTQETEVSNPLYSLLDVEVNEKEFISASDENFCSQYQ